ncbi:MAG: hypothetical protein WCO57_05610 [Verrucomicrobiota bacterium]
MWSWLWLAEKFEKIGWLDDLNAESLGSGKIADVACNDIPDSSLKGKLENRFIIGIAQDRHPTIEATEWRDYAWLANPQSTFFGMERRVSAC